MNKVFKKLCFLAMTAFFLAGVIYWWQQKKITFSVIIPVYNAEKYLPKCLDSVFAQKGNFEVIAVNDGSKDRSLQILQEYAKKHKNLKIIDQKNQGVSMARNAGLAVSQNKYITFVDSDDWLEPNAFEVVSEVIQKDSPDIVRTDFYDVYDKQWVKDVRGEKDAETITSDAKFPSHQVDMLSILSPFWAKESINDLYFANISVHGFFVSKEFLERHEIVFPSELRVAEDFVFIYKCFFYNPCISVLSEPLYNYHNSVDSVSKSVEMLEKSRESLKVMENTDEFSMSPRRIQLLMRDHWLSLVILGIANLERHGIAPQSGFEQASRALQSFSIYNEKELKSARNYQKLRNMLMGGTH